MSPVHVPPLGSVVFFQGRDALARLISWTTLSLSMYVYILATVAFAIGAGVALYMGLRYSAFACYAATAIGLFTIYAVGSLPKPSHVAIITEVPAPRKPRVVLLEATTQCDLPCVLQRKKVRGVQAHDYDERVMAYDGRVWIYEPREPLTKHERDELSAFSLAEVGRDYSMTGAAISATRIVKWFKRDVLRIEEATAWCSQLVVKLLKSIDRYPLGFHSNRSPAAVERDLRDTEQFIYRRVR